ncbi:Methionine--tRNA ligase [Hondaea fermentalgiana]|uniref:methionine--tRNA ligase n=1 Tax=Hondaea fermentalgiana TaxID=2315210 RepID=A0A2R5G053_9STRA|nr:Methionine--tRNA ligase [Hondaea fermentalgiana]|eukprot:GBG24392.1 Methionine--tRNA ligase [Hondaea fermentalgiana]
MAEAADEVSSRLSLVLLKEVAVAKKTKEAKAKMAAAKEGGAAAKSKKLKGNNKEKANNNAKLDRPLVAPACPAQADEAVRNEKFYLTTAINYTNGDPHMGHAYEAATCDVIARYHRTYGRDVFFLTGSDEHGQKVEQSAIKNNVTPQAIADKYSAQFQALNAKLNVSNDFYVRTTMPHHGDFCRALWTRVREKGDVYLKDYVGWYNVHEEKYVTDKEAEEADYKDEHGRPFEKKSEESYFFRMSKYQDALIKMIKEDNPLFVQPESRRREVLSFLESQELQDLCISRTVCQWGVKCPEDPEYKGDKSHVMYVWFDALSNYMSGINCLGCADDPNNLARFWPANVHVIGKDITRFHCVIWPAMLMSAEIPLPVTVFGHGFVQAEGGVKMGKSLGNAVDPIELLKLYPADALRFYMARATPYGEDLSFSEKTLCLEHNAALKDGLGNLVHRATSLCKSYCDAKIPSEAPAQMDGTLPFDVAELRDIFEIAFSLRPAEAAPGAEERHPASAEMIQNLRGGAGLQLRAAGEAVLAAISSLNNYLQRLEPWKIKGKDDEAMKTKRSIVRGALEGIYAVAHFLAPFCPMATQEVFHKLGVQPTALPCLSTSFDNLPPGTLTYVGPILFDELAPGVGVVQPGGDKKKSSDAQAEMKANKAKKAAGKAAAQAKAKKESQQVVNDGPEVTKIEFRVGKIVKVWEHEDSDKIFCEEIDVGEDAPRQIGSGLRKYYQLSDLQDRMVVVCCNLKPRPLAGFMSHGMVICATGADKVEILDPPAGSKIGERVGLKGMDPNEHAPETANKVARKKIFEAVAKKLKTNDACVASWDGIELATSAGPCTVPSLANAQLS